MIFLDELRHTVLYKKPFIIPINETNKRKASAIFLLSPNTDISIDMMHKPYIINNRYFQSYYIEKDITYYLDQSGNISESNISAIPGHYEDNTYELNENYLRSKIDGVNYISFLDEAGDAKYNAPLRKILYSDRIRNNKEVLALYKIIRDMDPNITRTFINLELYKTFNVFIDLSYYNQVFFKNNMYKLDRGVELYFDLINRFIDSKKVDNAGYVKKTIFVPTYGWDIKPGTIIYDYTSNINPISVIYRLMRKNPNKLKEAWGNYNFVFLGERGYFKIDFNDFDLRTLPRISMFLNKLTDSSATIEDPVDENPNKESTKAIVANIVDKIEKSQNITINNLTGNPTTITKDQLNDKFSKAASTSSGKVDNPEVQKKNDKVPTPVEKVDTTISNPNKIDTENKISTDKSTDADKEIEKEKLVSKIKDIAAVSNNTEEAIDNMEQDENIKKILASLAAEEDNEVKINATRASRVAKLDAEFEEKTIKNKTVKQMLEEKPYEKELPSTSLKVDSINPEWQDMKFTNFQKVYDVDKDIIKILHSFSEMTVPVMIRNIEVVDSTTSEDYIETYTVNCEDINGQRFTLKFDIPKLKNNRFMRLRGNEKVINGQLMLLPVIKTDNDTVQVVSNYNKIFVRRYRTSTGKSFVLADLIIKAITKLGISNKEVKVVTGDNHNICAKYELPIDYIDLSSEYTTLETKDYIIYFNQDDIRSKYKIDLSKGVPIAYDKNSRDITYYNDELIKIPCSDMIISMLYSSSDDFKEAYKSVKVSNKYTYSKASILNTEIPVIVVMGFSIGLQNALKKANIQYELSEKKPNVSDRTRDVIKFKDGYLSYLLDYNSSLLMNGLKDCDTANYSLSEINDRSMWIDFLDNFGGRIKADGLDNFYDLMIDPITKEVCNRYNLPDNYIDILVYANTLLADNKYNRHTDITGNRYRTNELIAGYTYNVLAEAYGDYRNQLRRNRTGSTMSVKQSAIIDSILLDRTTSDLSILNPLLEAESSNTTSFKGLSGMNSDRAYGLDKRTYDESMINILALSTGFAANVGINRQATIDMNIEGERGYIKTTDNKDNMNITKTFGMTEALTPLGTTHDDPFRSAMTFIQTAKHNMRVTKSMPMLITNGADEALPYLTSDTFAFKAKKDGKIIEKTDDYMIIGYNDGTNDYVDLRELVKKNSDGGFFVTIKLDTDYKLGNRVKANDIVAYDKLSYSDTVGATDNIAYNVGTLCKCAILNTDEGYEDSGIISDYLSDAMASEVVVKKEVVLPKTTNIYNIVKKGQNVQEGESLLIFQNAFDDNDMNILLKNLSDDEQDITDLARIPIKSKITGIVEDIQIYRTVDKDELSDSLKKVVNQYERDANTIRGVMEKYNIDAANEFTPDYKLEATGKLKNARDSVLIEFYLKYYDKMAVGDKAVFYSAAKAVVKDIFPNGEEPYSEFRKDEKIHSLMAVGSLNARMITSTKMIAGINKVLIELDRSVKDIMDVPYRNLDEM